MNYTEIKDLSLAFADRAQDTEVLDNYDGFLRLVESRINRHLKTDDMTIRTALIMDESKRYYSLPSDFNGLRDIKFAPTGNLNRVCTFHLASLENISLARNNSTDQIFYAIVAKQLFINPVQTNDYQLEILYYCKINPLIDLPDEDTNWITEENPDCYINGICYCIAKFAKDGDAADFWKDKFEESIGEIKIDDSKKTYSGPQLITMVVS